MTTRAETFSDDGIGVSASTFRMQISFIKQSLCSRILVGEMLG